MRVLGADEDAQQLERLLAPLGLGVNRQLRQGELRFQVLPEEPEQVNLILLIPFGFDKRKKTQRVEDSMLNLLIFKDRRKKF